MFINTCTIREAADNRMYGNLGQLKEWKDRHPEALLVVGGCAAQKDRELVRERAPWVDVVMGTNNLDRVLDLIDYAQAWGGITEIADELEAMPSSLPVRRELAHSAWISIQVGCNNSCTFCIVPAVRGPEVSRRPGDILREVGGLAARGRRRDHPSRPERRHLRPRPGNRRQAPPAVRRTPPSGGFDRGDSPGPFHQPPPGRLPTGGGGGDGRDPGRVRATSPSASVGVGSDPGGHAPRLQHRPIPGEAIPRPSRDPGPFGFDRHHRRLSRRDRRGLRGNAGVDGRGSGSTRPSCSSSRPDPEPGPATMVEQFVPHEVIQERFDRLVALQNRISLELNLAMVGQVVEVLGRGSLAQRRGGRGHQDPGRQARSRTWPSITPAPSLTCS